MMRIAILDRNDMDAEQARVYDEAKNAHGILGGAYYAYIRLPGLFKVAQDLRMCLANEPLTRREQLIVNLTVSRYWNAPYPWCAQVRGALATGISKPIIAAINARAVPDLPDAREMTCFTVANELLANKKLSDKTYASAERIMGEKGLVALVAGTGSFSMTCLTTTAFGIDPPADNPVPLGE